MAHVWAEFRSEALLMAGLEHPNIVQLLGITVRPFCIITELMSLGDLGNFLRRNVASLSWELRLLIARDVALGMQFLHDCTPPIVHRDLKSPNILLAEGQPLVAKVTDFGMSVRTGFQVRGRQVFNLMWLAPEIIQGQPYTEKVDIYSYGIVLWELLNGGEPFAEFRPKYQFDSQMEDAIVHQGLRPTIDASCPTTYKDLMQRCWHEIPAHRPTFIEILRVLRTCADQLAPQLTARAWMEAVVPGVQLEAQAQREEAKADPRDELLPLRPAADTSPVDLNRSTSSLDVSNRGSVGAYYASVRLGPMAGSIQCLLMVGSEVWCGCGDGSICILSVTNASQSKIKEFPAHNGAVYCLALVDDAVWSSGKDCVINVWNARTAKNEKALRGFQDAPTCMRQVGDFVWTGCVGGSIQVWKKYKMKKEFRHSGSIGSLYASSDPNHPYIWVGTDRNLLLFDARELTPYATIEEAHKGMIHCIISVNDSIWTSSTDKIINIWRRNGELIKSVEGHSGRVFTLCHIGPHVWSGSWDKTIFIWSAVTYNFLQELKGPFITDSISAVLPLPTEADSVSSVWVSSWDKYISVFKYAQPPRLTPEVFFQGWVSLRPANTKPKSGKKRWVSVQYRKLYVFDGPRRDKLLHTISLGLDSAVALDSLSKSLTVGTGAADATTFEFEDDSFETFGVYLQRARS